ncbi:hypothetical protein CCM_07754 [Cordyceps militaris CM01]|uniref:Uncharacterized protein n=1 Tax=Cordyceps militaris (strain CM01) TaxID=983644 RepID=G3JQJ8_CORMM|nr:uncharacterized protein CCM_07754 [Cordyceps militaris CM01]EGX89502.1 hypothetical protein CCM_07754 [Cordyceps militaris CM01]
MTAELDFSPSGGWPQRLEDVGYGTEDVGYGTEDYGQDPETTCHNGSPWTYRKEPADVFLCKPARYELVVCETRILQGILQWLDLP